MKYRHLVFCVVLLSGWISAGESLRAALIEFLPLNGTTTATVGTSGTAVNGPAYVAGPYGSPNGAIAFAPGGSPTSSYVSVAGGGGLDGLETGTIAFFAKWTGTQQAFCCGADYGAITARQSNGAFSDDIIGLDNANPAVAHVELRLDQCCGVTVAESSTVVGNGVWNFIAVTFTAGSENLYLNGTLVGTATGTPNVHSNPAVPLTLGAWAGDGNEYSNSAMSDFRVYDTVLSQSQIRQIPEPASLVLCGLGGVGLLAIARRRRKA